MKKNTIYITIIAIFIIALGAIYYRYATIKAPSYAEQYSLLPRKGATANSPEWLKVKAQAYTLEQKIKANSADTKSLIQLSTLFIQEARATGNFAYYDKAAMKYVNDVLAQDEKNFEALTLKSLLYLSQHHFSEGLDMAEQAKTMNPYNSFVWGIMVDGNVEMGNYAAAVTDADSMLAIRPDIRSYSRASYLREIYGDYPGAISAMKLAVEAGFPGDESTEWCRVQLGHLYENTGDLLNAKMQYTIAAQNRPEYAYALAGLARIAVAEKQYNNAITYYQQADSSVTDFSIKDAMADVYEIMGKNKEAHTLRNEVIQAMSKEAESGNSDANIGHYVDKELAYAYLKIDNYESAEKHALLEYNRRPDNIDVNECVAWVYYNKGEYAKALPYIKNALKTNSKNPVLLCRAGLIYAKTGEKMLAKATLQNALSANPNITDMLKTESINTLQTL
ncbi:tetratricopeptide repeat protein [Limnovirga soli]|uniref:Transposase n=1 Tax=Limnovirga soli TaxID=2656915 RepID=A0A8J8JS72_9BACT|nr:tetratricopeptide repeat protein [Limnovirga soli]NNV56627.1 transposase [Limnovirga soli]